MRSGLPPSARPLVTIVVECCGSFSSRARYVQSMSQLKRKLKRGFRAAGRSSFALTGSGRPAQCATIPRLAAWSAARVGARLAFGVPSA